MNDGEVHAHKWITHPALAPALEMSISSRSQSLAEYFSLNGGGRWSMGYTIRMYYARHS
jgi:hypothetical protein